MSRRILSVGYEQVSLTLRNWVLERAGYTVLPAISKSQALQVLKRKRCQLVLIAGNIAKPEVLEIVSAAGVQTPVLWLFSGTREELPGIAAYMPLLDGPEQLLDNVRELLAAPRPVAPAHEKKTAEWYPFLEKPQLRPKRRA